jgi:polyphosphate kinase 2 (PPK2 family)
MSDGNRDNGGPFRRVLGEMIDRFDKEFETETDSERLSNMPGEIVARRAPGERGRTQWYFQRSYSRNTPPV